MARYDDPAVDQALDTGRRSQDPATREAAYDTLQQRPRKEPRLHLPHPHRPPLRPRRPLGRPDHAAGAARARLRQRPVVEHRGLAAEEVTRTALGSDGAAGGAAGPVRRPRPARGHLRCVRDRRRLPVRSRAGVRRFRRARRRPGDPGPAARQPRRGPASHRPLVGVAHVRARRRPRPVQRAAAAGGRR